uniref:(northern house mosquito) hypothetical protein n=1 Tax=Culex pipiens TaxID=7175 RepID=A0A8D8K3E1_CULPI
MFCPSLVFLLFISFCSLHCRQGGHPGQDTDHHILSGHPENWLLLVLGGRSRHRDPLVHSCKRHIAAGHSQGFQGRTPRDAEGSPHGGMAPELDGPHPLEVKY